MQLIECSEYNIFEPESEFNLQVNGPLFPTCIQSTGTSLDDRIEATVLKILAHDDVDTRQLIQIVSFPPELYTWVKSRILDLLSALYEQRPADEFYYPADTFMIYRRKRS